MALGKYSRLDGRKSPSSYCSTVSLVVFVALCLVGVWMLTSSSIVPVQNVDVSTQEAKDEVKDRASEINEKNTSNENTESNAKQFENNPGDLPEEATKSDNNVDSAQEENTNTEKNSDNLEKTNEKAAENNREDEPVNESSQEEKKSDDAPKTEKENGDEESKTGSKDSEAGETKVNGNDEKKGDSGAKESKADGNDEKKGNSEAKKAKPDDNELKKVDSEEDSNVEKSDSDQRDKKSEDNDGGTVEGDKDESPSEGKEHKDGDGLSKETFTSGPQSELLNETATQNGEWKTQASESKKEQEASAAEYKWKLCNVTAGPDYIPCLDNLQAIKNLRSTKHYEHRERQCPEDSPTCLVALPDGYQRPIDWPTSREKIWYHNVPHAKLAEVKGHQNWVKVSGNYLTFPGGGTQFKYGALHYIDFIQQSVPDIAWGKQTRVVLDVGCGVASFGGYLFDREVLTMSFAPKDEHEAQVQFALERGIPGISAVMGTKRLPFPGRVFDAVHCARCRVPWHIEGGKLLLELNRVLRPGGFFVWSATPVYQKISEDAEIWEAMKQLTKAMCWELVSKTRDTVNRVGIAIYRKPVTNECYEKRSKNEPPVCQGSDDPNAAWNVPLQSCMHQIPVDMKERGSRWPEQWSARLTKPPYWLLSSNIGVYGKPAPEDFAADYEHWKRVVTNSYLNGMASILLCCGVCSNRKKQAWRVFSLKELHAATDNFNYDNKIGEGGYGSVYWGHLWGGSQIAVKRLKVWSDKADMEFGVEVEILARIRHKNLLSLRGYCAEGRERLIVYNYMPNMSLISHLRGQQSADCLLDWNRRMSIAIGSAEGIAYLHHHATPRIIHRDVKASNVLLDADFQPLVADFGFAKLIPDGASHVTTRVKGTIGYLAPEYAMHGKASESCDVYSFGILLLELASSKKPLEKLSSKLNRSITEWALPLVCDRKYKEIVDPRLKGKYVEEELRRVVLVALICAHSKPKKRPSMLEVVELLKGEAKEKFHAIENDELFKCTSPAELMDRSCVEDGSDSILEERESREE